MKSYWGNIWGCYNRRGCCIRCFISYCSCNICWSILDLLIRYWWVCWRRWIGWGLCWLSWIVHSGISSLVIDPFRNRNCRILCGVLGIKLAYGWGYWPCGQVHICSNGCLIASTILWRSIRSCRNRTGCYLDRIFDIPCKILQVSTSSL